MLPFPKRSPHQFWLEPGPSLAEIGEDKIIVDPTKRKESVQGYFCGKLELYTAKIIFAHHVTPVETGDRGLNNCISTGFRRNSE
jgi:hypothetical protein